MFLPVKTHPDNEAHIYYQVGSIAALPSSPPLVYPTIVAIFSTSLAGAESGLFILSHRRVPTLHLALLICGPCAEVRARGGGCMFSLQ